VYFSYLVVLFYCHFIWLYLTCLNLIINGKWKWKWKELTKNALLDCLLARHQVVLSGSPTGRRGYNSTLCDKEWLTVSLADLWIFITIIAAVIASITQIEFINAATTVSMTLERMPIARMSSYNNQSNNQSINLYRAIVQTYIDKYLVWVPE